MPNSTIVPISELNKMVIAATDGVPYDPPTPEAAKLWPQIKREVGEIKGRGHFVHLYIDP
jgi:hypothetical protein